jgi:hypothetical protein
VQSFSLLLETNSQIAPLPQVQVVVASASETDGKTYTST